MNRINLGKSAQIVALFIALLFSGCFVGHQKVDFIEQENWYDKMDKEEVQLYNLHVATFNRLVFVDYANSMNLLDNNGEVTRESVKRFSSLFMEKATVWNDIHYDPHPISPSDYGAFVKHFMYKGVNAEIFYYGDFDRAKLDKRLHRYYRVGGGEHEYYMHRAVEKKIFYGLNEKMEVVGWGEGGKSLLLDFVVYFNDKTGDAKIAEIKPLLN